MGLAALAVLYTRTQPADPPPPKVVEPGEQPASQEPPRASLKPMGQGAKAQVEVPMKTALGPLRWTIEGDRARMGGKVMGTTFHLTVLETDGAKLEALGQGAAGALDAVDKEMSTYKPNSGISIFNRLQGSGTLISRSFVDVLEVSALVHDKSGGAFDPTVGALVRAWGFGPDEALPKAPDNLEALRKNVNFADIVWKTDDHDRYHLYKKSPEVQLDLSAVAKGFAADQVCASFEELGQAHYMVEVGGEICVAGKAAPDRNWRVGVERPNLNPAQGGLQRALELGPDMQPVGMATSGDYRNYREVDGVRISHTIDPRTGRPVTHKLASVTVLAPSSAQADAWATALMVLGPEEGFERATQEGVAAYFIVREGDAYTERDTPAFATLVEPTWAPEASKPVPEKQ